MKAHEVIELIARVCAAIVGVCCLLLVIGAATARPIPGQDPAFGFGLAVVIGSIGLGAFVYAFRPGPQAPRYPLHHPHGEYGAKDSPSPRPPHTPPLP